MYHIDGYVDDAKDGDTVTILKLVTDNSKKSFSQAIVKEGRFHFDGTVNGCEIAYVCLNSASKDFCPVFFIEKGNLELNIGNSFCKATGTPLNDLKNIVEDSIMSYIGMLEDIEDVYYSVVTDDRVLSQLGVTGLGLQENLVSFLHRTITENIDNSLGGYLLVVFHDFFAIDELLSLLSNSSIRSEKNQFYNMILGIIDERQQL